jgi:hypothetical protein
MGNSLGADKGSQKPAELSALNKAEERSLTILYGKLFPEGCDGVADAAQVAKVFETETVPDFSQALVKYMKENGVTNLTGFLVMMAKCSRGRADECVRFIWEVCCLCDQGEDNNPQILFFKVLLEFGQCAVDGIEQTARVLYAHLAKNMSVKSPADVSLHALVEWGHEFAPNMSRLLVTFLNRTCYADVELLSYVPFCPPVLEVPSNIVTQSALLPLALYTTACQGKWRCLYTTARDGISFNRVAHNILGYGGQTCIMIKSTTGDVFGIFSDAPWKDSNRFYGNSNSFLFSLVPQFKILRSSATTNGAFQWLNLKSYGLPHGIGVGGTNENFRLHIPDSLEDCLVRTQCDTFERGRLISSGERFEIMDLEVFGVGGDLAVAEALQAQGKDRNMRNELIQKARTVDKAAFLDNSFDQEFLLSKTFSHKVRAAKEDQDPTKMDDADRAAAACEP